MVAPEATGRSGRFRWIVRLGGGALLVWAATAGAIAFTAWSHLQQGMDTLDAGRESLDLEDLATNRPAVLLARAATRFERASAAIDSPAIWPLRWLPIVGRQLRAVDGLATTARDVTRAAEQSSRQVAAAIREVPAGGAARIAAIDRIDDAIAAADRALAAVDLGPSRALVGPVARRRDRVVIELRDARRGLAGARAGTATVRGLVAGPRRYLLVAANNAEMRAGVGMFLSVGVLETTDGTMRLGAMRRAGDLALPDDGVPVTGDFDARWGFTRPGAEWRSLAMSPRFAASADVAARMWTAATGQAVDGLLAVDVPALEALIGATGPVSAGGVEMSTENAEDFLLHDQYEQYDDSHEERRDLLGDLAAAVVARLEAGHVDPAALVKGLRAAVRGRHLIAWAASEDEQRGWESMGAAGELNPNSLALALLNRGGNKLDPFVRMNATLESTAAMESRVSVRVHVRVENRTPSDEPPYVAGPGRGLAAEAGTYVGFLALTLPGAATSATVRGGPLIAAGRDGPTQVVATQLELARGEAIGFTFEFDLPTAIAASVRLEPSARIPPTRWHVGDDAWRDDKPRRLKLSP